MTRPLVDSYWLLEGQLRAGEYGAVYGQLAGAYYGEDGIPSEWRARITQSTEIADLATKLHDLAQADV